MNHARMLAMPMLLVFCSTACSSRSETSPVLLLSESQNRIEAYQTDYPEALTGETARNKLTQAARSAQGEILEPGDTEEVGYRFDRLAEPVSVQDGKILRLTLAADHSPVLFFTADSQGMVTAAAGIPATAREYETISVEVEPTGDDQIAGFGFIGAGVLEWTRDTAPSLAIDDPGSEAILSGPGIVIPAGIRIQQLDRDILIEGLSLLTQRGQSPGSAGESDPFIDLEYRYEMPEVAENRLPELVRVNLQAGLADGTVRDMELRLRPGETSVYLHPGFVGGVTGQLRIIQPPEDFSLLRLSARTVSQDSHTPEPLPADLGTLYNYPPEHWRQDSFELFSWNLFPQVLFFDFQSYADQARFFRRLAYFVEKIGYQETLLSHKELVHRHGYNAHNYNAEGLADFFNAVHQQDFPIYPQEELLRRIIHKAGIITGEPGSYQPGEGGVLSVSQDSPFSTGLRNLFLAHEAMHGVFYQQQEFARFGWDFWENEMTESQRDFWRLFMQVRNYSPDDTYLMVNELQGYLLQYPHRNNNWYFNTAVRNQILDRYPDRQEEVDRFYRDNPDFFVNASLRMNQQLFRTAGLIGGDVRDLLHLQ